MALFIPKLFFSFFLFFFFSCLEYIDRVKVLRLASVSNKCDHRGGLKAFKKPSRPGTPPSSRPG